MTILSDHVRELNYVLTDNSLEEPLYAITQLLCSVRRVFVAGNGGSAAISDHLVCDFMKGSGGPAIISLTSNTPLLTALANDNGYESVFSDQLHFHKVSSTYDAVILISASGNSPNIVSAANYCNDNNICCIAMVGFDGGRLVDYVSPALCLHIKSHQYGVVEDAHQTLMHVIAKMIREKTNYKGKD